MNIEEQIAKYAANYDHTIKLTQPERYCAKCQRLINFNPYNGDHYCGCWCGRWWCCEAHALSDGWVFRGDAYETDLVECNYCHKKS